MGSGVEAQAMAAVPAKVGSSAHSLTTALADILARPVPSRLHGRAALHVLDWAGCAISGAASDAGKAMSKFGARLAAGTSTKAGACAIGVGRVGVLDAAFVNGSYGNALEMDDIHRTSILHPGPVVVPAALAVAEREDASAAEFLNAVVRGYEAMIRVGRSVGPGHYRHWHNTSTCGPFGAAAAAGSLLRLGPAQMVDALGNAGTQSAGPWQCRLEGSMSKQLHSARAAHAGIVAADLAALGFTGPAKILEGELGFYAAMCPDPDPDAVTGRDGPEWLIEETSFKPWPACRHAHPTIDAALALCDRVDATAVESVVVRTYADAVRYCDNQSPRTVLEAKFSLQHCAAVVLLDGEPPLEAFEAPAFEREDVAALRAKVRLETAEPFARSYPDHYGAGVTVIFEDGRQFSEERPDALGDPDNPIDTAAIEAKARMLMTSGGMSAEQVDAIGEAVHSLPLGGTLRAFTDLLP